MKPLFCLALFLLSVSKSQAAFWFDKNLNGKPLYEHFKDADIPTDALERTLAFLEINEDKNLKVKASQQLKTIKISNKKYAIIIDFSKPSSQKRLFLLNLDTGEVEKNYVAHGVNTGEDYASKFSNEIDSKKTSLGFYLTGPVYMGSKGEALILYGLDKSNDNAFERTIVMHGADYVSPEFLNKYGRMGRSWGCFTLEHKTNKKLVPLLSEGTVIYAYHKGLMLMAQTSPAVQNMGGDQKDASEDSNKIVPEELNP